MGFGYTGFGYTGFGYTGFGYTGFGNMGLAFRSARRVQFRDTDAAGLLHFSMYFVYMEELEHEFLRSLGRSVVERVPQGKLSWPRVGARCDYRGPARFEDVLDLELTITRLGEKSVTYQTRFSRDGKELAVGQVTAVCCLFAGDQPPAAAPIPDEVAVKLRPYVASDPST